MEDKDDKAIRFYDKDDHYELFFMSFFTEPGKQSGTDEPDLSCDIIKELLQADPLKELHIFIFSYGGSVSVLSTILQLIRRFRRTIAVNMRSRLQCWMDAVLFMRRALRLST